MESEISELTRRSLGDRFALEGLNWAGNLNEEVFLARLYDLASMPSHDHRYRNAASDIHQHRVRNTDWGNDWVFTDTRFNLLRAPRDELLKFLCETLHPAVQRNAENVKLLAQVYNEVLAADGWSLVEAKLIAGQPIFESVKCDSKIEIFQDPTGWQKVDRQMLEARKQFGLATDEEHFQTVGLLCREVLITVGLELFKPNVHKIPDDVKVSSTDAKRMLEAIFAFELSGSSNEPARKHAKAAVDLALSLQHKRTADFKTAALCMEGTVSVVNMLAIVFNRRSPLRV